MRTSRGLNRRVQEQRIWSNSLGFDRIPLGHGEREKEKREGRKERRDASAGVLGWSWAGSGSWPFSFFLSKHFLLFLFSVF